MDEWKKKTRQVRSFARHCGYEQEHCEQATGLALRIFDAVKNELSLTEGDRFLLECGGILHDIGWLEGQKGHHKAAMRMILEDASMPLDSEERKLIALIARYHRKALPKSRHAVYQDLSEPLRRKVSVLAGILRIADGLDRSHMNAVEDVKVDRKGKSIAVLCRTKGPALSEIRAAQKKADLLEKTMGKRVRIQKMENGEP